jgi:hypothetical protein
LPAGVCTVTVKSPVAGIMVDVIVVVSCALLTTVVARAVPLKITTEEETKWLPFAVRVKMEGKPDRVIDAGEIESRTGTGRALPHRGFNDLHPGENRTTISKKPARPIRLEERMKQVYAEKTHVSVNHPAYDPCGMVFAKVSEPR